MLAALLLWGCSTTPAGEEVTISAEAGTLTFAVLGDPGTGDHVQHNVGTCLAEICAVKDCAMALVLGDNIYDDGVSSIDDPLFDERFEAPYAAVRFPFYVAPGNHDYGWHGMAIPTPWSDDKIQLQIDYSAQSDKWTMPGRYFSVREESGLAAFVAMDTTRLVWTKDAAQVDWIEETVGGLDETWRFAFGHHTIRSNGKHGNSGRYPVIEGATGAPLQRVFDDHLCGGVDVVFTGHDHNLQWHAADCGTEVVVSGSAGKFRPLRDRAEWHNAEPVFPDGDASTAEQPGFMLVELTADRLTGSFYGPGEGTAPEPCDPDSPLFQRTIER